MDLFLADHVVSRPAACRPAAVDARMRVARPVVRSVVRRPSDRHTASAIAHARELLLTQCFRSLSLVTLSHLDSYAEDHLRTLASRHGLAGRPFLLAPSSRRPAGFHAPAAPAVWFSSLVSPIGHSPRDKRHHWRLSHFHRSPSAVSPAPHSHRHQRCSQRRRLRPLAPTSAL